MLLLSKKIVFLALLFVVCVFPQQDLQEGVRYFGNREWQKAIDFFRISLLRNPEQKLAYHYLGAAYLETGKNNEAYSILASGSSKFPDEKTIVGNFINAGVLTGRTDEPIKAGLRYLKKYPADTAIKELVAAAFSKKADNLFNAGKYTGSMDAARTALKYKSSDDNAYSLIIRNYLLTGKVKESVSEGERAAKNFPASLPVQTAYLSALNASQEFEKALTLALRLNKHFGNDIDFQMQLGFLYRANYKIKEGSAVFERLVNMYPSIEKVYDGAVTYFESLNQFDKVRALYEAKIKAFGREKEFRIKIAESYDNEKLPEQARGVYFSMLNKSEDSEVRMLLALSYLESGVADSSEMQLKNILQNDTANYDAMKLLCGVYLERKSQKNLLLSAGLFNRQYNKDFFANYYLAAALLNEGNRGTAREFAEKAKKINPLSPLPFRLLADISGASSDPAGTKFYLNQSILKSLAQIKEMESAISQLVNEISATNSSAGKRKASSMKKELAELRAVVNSGFAELRKLSSAEEYRIVLNSILRSFPNNPFVLSEKGRFHQERGEKDSAKYFYGRALEANPNLAACHSGLANIYAAGGNLSEAIKSLRRAVAAEPSNIEAYDKLIEYSIKNLTDRTLADDWINVYKTDRSNTVLRERLIELLHKTNRFEEANKIIRNIID